MPAMRDRRRWKEKSLGGTIPPLRIRVPAEVSSRKECPGGGGRGGCRKGIRELDEDLDAGLKKSRSYLPALPIYKYVHASPYEGLSVGLLVRRTVHRSVHPSVTRFFLTRIFSGNGIETKESLSQSKYET